MEREDRRAKPSFSIKRQTGHYANLGEGRYRWIAAEQPTRYADIYVFAYHPVTGPEPDQCDPAQWVFYVVPTSTLPDSASSLSLERVQLLSPGL